MTVRRGRRTYNSTLTLMNVSPSAYVPLCVRHPLHVLPPGATGDTCKFDMGVRGKFRMDAKVTECARAARLKSHLHTTRSIEEEPSVHTKRHLQRGFLCKKPKRAVSKKAFARRQEKPS